MPLSTRPIDPALDALEDQLDIKGSQLYPLIASPPMRTTGLWLSKHMALARTTSTLLICIAVSAQLHAQKTSGPGTDTSLADVVARSAQLAEADAKPGEPLRFVDFRPYEAARLMSDIYYGGGEVGHSHLMYSHHPIVMMSTYGYSDTRSIEVANGVYHGVYSKLYGTDEQREVSGEEWIGIRWMRGTTEELRLGNGYSYSEQYVRKRFAEALTDRSSDLNLAAETIKVAAEHQISIAEAFSAIFTSIDTYGRSFERFLRDYKETHPATVEHFENNLFRALQREPLDTIEMIWDEEEWPQTDKDATVQSNTASTPYAACLLVNEWAAAPQPLLFKTVGGAAFIYGFDSGLGQYRLESIPFQRINDSIGKKVISESDRQFYLEQYPGLSFALTAFGNRFRTIRQVTVAAECAPTHAEWDPYGSIHRHPGAVTRSTDQAAVLARFRELEGSDEQSILLFRPSTDSRVAYVVAKVFQGFGQEWVEPEPVYYGALQRHLSCVDQMILETGSFFGRSRSEHIKSILSHYPQNEKAIELYGDIDKFLSIASRAPVLPELFK